jgi:hypothetical protein
MFATGATGSLTAFALVFIEFGLFLKPFAVPGVLLIKVNDIILDKSILVEDLVGYLSNSFGDGKFGGEIGREMR